MRYHDITKDDMRNGDGLRVTLWLSGCSHMCSQCQNPQTWDPDSGVYFDKAARDELYENIDKRVDDMIKKGLVDEVRNLAEMGLDESYVSMKGLGYKEILRCLNGDIGLDEAIRIIKRDTRHFAKRQLTWFKRERDCIWINKDEFGYDDNRIIDFMMSCI